MIVQLNAGWLCEVSKRLVAQNILFVAVQAEEIFDEFFEFLDAGAFKSGSFRRAWTRLHLI